MYSQTTIFWLYYKTSHKVMNEIHGLPKAKPINLSKGMRFTKYRKFKF